MPSEMAQIWGSAMRRTRHLFFVAHSEFALGILWTLLLCTLTYSGLYCSALCTYYSAICTYYSALCTYYDDALVLGWTGGDLLCPCLSLTLPSLLTSSCPLVAFLVLSQYSNSPRAPNSHVKFRVLNRSRRLTCPNHPTTQVRPLRLFRVLLTFYTLLLLLQCT